MKHVICVGAVFLDTILTVPHYPDEDTKMRASSLQVRRGGNCANTLEVLQQLLAAPFAPAATAMTAGGSGAAVQTSQADVALHLVSCLPRAGSTGTSQVLSSFGGGINKEEHSQMGRINFGHCLYREAHEEPGRCYVIRSCDTDSRTIVSFSDLPDMSVDEFIAVADTFKGETETWWHFEVRHSETTLQCIEHLRQSLPHCKISVEVENPSRTGLAEVAAEADVVFYSRAWAESRGYADAEACLRGELLSRVSLAVCTWAAQGACAISPPTGETVRCMPDTSAPGFKVVDTVGAGDTVIAGVLYGLVCHTDDWAVETKLRFAVHLATAKVQREGFAGLATALCSYRIA